MNLTITIAITETGENLHDIDIETKGIEVDDLPNLFDYLVPKITMRHHLKRVK